MYASHMGFFFEMTGCKAWKAIGSKGSHAKSKGWDSHHRRHRGMHLFNMHLMKYADHFFTLKIVWSSAEAVIDGWFIISFSAVLLAQPLVLVVNYMIQGRCYSLMTTIRKDFERISLINSTMS